MMNASEILSAILESTNAKSKVEVDEPYAAAAKLSGASIEVASSGTGMSKYEISVWNAEKKSMKNLIWWTDVRSERGLQAGIDSAAGALDALTE